jgi:hypothetical protein
MLKSCCTGTKCVQTYLGSAFKIIDSQTGEDLLFGANRMYNPYLVRMYSISGSDTVYHNSRPGKYSPPPDLDSLLFGGLSYDRYETIYVALNQWDIDTMTISYGRSDGGACCPDSYWIQSIDYNNMRLKKQTSELYIINK